MSELALLPCPSGPELPTLIVHAGEKTAWRFLEFFTVKIRHKNTRAAYGQVAGSFLRWCEGRGISRIEDVQPVHVAAYIEEQGKVRAAPTVKQHLACIRMLFDWLVTGQVVASNPACCPGARVTRSKKGLLGDVVGRYERLPERARPNNADTRGNLEPVSWS
jgi:hypothetical protein